LIAQGFVIRKMVRSRNFSTGFPGRINSVFNRKLYFLNRLLAALSVSHAAGEL
jgi:hypothetical protein